MSKPSKIEALLSVLPNKANLKEKWTLEEDAALLKFASTKGVVAVAQALGKSRNAAYDRFRKLKAKVGK